MVRLSGDRCAYAGTEFVTLSTLRRARDSKSSAHDGLRFPADSNESSALALARHAPIQRDASVPFDPPTGARVRYWARTSRALRARKERRLVSRPREPGVARADSCDASPRPQRNYCLRTVKCEIVTVPKYGADEYDRAHSPVRRVSESSYWPFQTTLSVPPASR